MTENMSRAIIGTEADARADLGGMRSKPAWMERSHTLPFGELSPDEFEVFSYLLLLLEQSADPAKSIREVYYLGKTRDRGRDIVCTLSDSSAQFIQCKRYERGLGIQEVRNELAKLYSNAFAGLIEKPTHVVFHVSTHLTSPAHDLLFHIADWKTEIEDILEEFLGKKPTAEFLAFAHEWRPKITAVNGLELTQRSQRFPSLIDEFFTARKVVDVSAVQAVQAELAALRDVFTAKFAPSQMEHLLLKLQDQNPGITFEARTTTHGTTYHLRATKPIGVRSPTFPDTEAGQRGRKKFQAFLDEGRPIVLTAGEFEWEPPLRDRSLIAPVDAEQTMELFQRIPEQSLTVRLEWVDENRQVVAQVPITYLWLTRFGREEIEVRICEGRLAAQLSIVFHANASQSDSLVFSLDLGAVRPEDAETTLALLARFGEKGSLRIIDLHDDRCLVDCKGLHRRSSIAGDFDDTRRLLKWLSVINTTLGVDLRYPNDKASEADATTAELLASAIQHGGRISVSKSQGHFLDISLGKDIAGRAVSEWEKGPLTFDGTQPEPFQLFGTSIPVGDALGMVRLFFVDSQPDEDLNLLRDRIAATPDGGIVKIAIRVTRIAYEFEKWLTG